METPKDSLTSPGTLPPATPVYVLRGHASPVHALWFYNENSRLASGDADGWVIVWDITSKRAVASWKAHDAGILGVQGIAFAPQEGADGEQEAGEIRIFTHGRDNALRVWRLNAKDEEILDKGLPVEDQSKECKSAPWLVYSLAVNALNFCAFALVFAPSNANIDTSSASQEKTANTAEQQKQGSSENRKPSPTLSSDMFIAVPNALNTGGIDIFHLPSERRVSMIHPDPAVNTGMVMALQLYFSSRGDLYVISGYEDGRAMVHVCRGAQIGSPDVMGSTWKWERVYMNKPHSQPVLSLSISPAEEADYFLTSSADSIIAKHPIPTGPRKAGKGGDAVPLKIFNTKHAGQQGLIIRSDEKIFVTAGWDCRVRVHSCKTMKELAVLKWHKEGCYAVALADVHTHAENSASEREAQDTELHAGSALTTRSQPGSLAAVKMQRSRKAQSTHWIAAGSKDGKISLWDIY